MGQRIRLWEVTAEKAVREIEDGGISLEVQLEDWLANDIAMLDPDLLVIGRQVMTDYGGFIDLLCIDAEGALVVVELKRGKTPREVTAQALDYASWVQDLEAIAIEAIADDHLGSKSALQEAFEAKFKKSLPELLNESHRSVVVAESIDGSTERVVRYLADLGVPINVATVQCFEDRAGRRLLAQVYLVEPKASASPNRRRGTYTFKQQQALAAQHGIGDLFSGIGGCQRVLHTRESDSGVVRYGRQVDGRRLTFLKITVTSDDGGMPFTVHVDRFTDHLGLSREQLESALPANAQESDSVRKWSTAEEKEGAVGIEGVFQTVEEVDTFVRTLQEAGQ